MFERGEGASGQFCWADLAAHDAGGAQRFYEELFGWTSRGHQANGGLFTRLSLNGRDIGSIYQLARPQLERGTPSHWTPYVQVNNADVTARRAAALGGEVIVRPFAVSGIARIALVVDSVGAPIGLWEPLRPDRKEGSSG